MTAAVKVPAHSLPALAVSVGLHGALLLLPLWAAGWNIRHAPALAPLPSSVALSGSSIEVDAPSPELSRAAFPGQNTELPLAAEPAHAEPAHAERAPEAEPTSDAAPAILGDPRQSPPQPRAPEAKPVAARKPPAVSESPKPGEHAAAATRAPVAERSGGERAATSADAPAGEGAPGTFGAEGLPPGVRRLGYAFTRAIPVATPADEAWRALPAGPVGTIRLVLTVDADSRVAQVETLPPRTGEPPLPAPLRRMAERTALLLRAGQFALSASNQPGKELLSVQVVLRDEAPEEDAVGVVVQKKFVGAEPGQAGSAYFRYDTGRVFEAKVTTSAAPD